MRSRLVPASLAVLALTLTTWAPAEAQRRYPLAPETAAGDYLHPMFESWYLNPDGTHTISFGYYNRNDGGDPVYIPIGPDNFVTPAEYDGMQPEFFADRRERGVFTVTVPADWPATEAVTWTLRNAGGEYSVPGRWGVGAYEMSHTGMASGSLPPALRMDPPNGPVHHGIVDVFFGEDKEAEVGEPLELTVWARDNMREDATRDSADVSVTWYKHQGAGAVVFSPDPTPPEPPAADSAAAGGRGGGGGGGGGGRGGGPPPPNVVEAPLTGDGMVTVMATFAEPGDYVLRAVVIAQGAGDSSFGNQCCWTTGFVRVEVDD